MRHLAPSHFVPPAFPPKTLKRQWWQRKEKKGRTMGQNSLIVGHQNHASPRTWEWVSERASKRVSGASEWGSGWVSGPLLTSWFKEVLITVRPHSLHFKTGTFNDAKTLSNHLAFWFRFPCTYDCQRLCLKPSLNQKHGHVVSTRSHQKLRAWYKP